MVRSQPFEKLLEMKRKKFFEVVYRICKKRKIPMPHINFEGCEGEDEDQLAHYHPETNTICVSDTQLCKLNPEQVEAVAAHEVSHILEKGHGSKFMTEESLSSIASFKPPSGTVFVTESKDNIKSKKYRKPKENKTRCNHHLCEERKKLTQCEYCEGYFCKEHLKPKPAGLPRFESTKPEDRLFMEEWRKKRGHPCIPYLTYWEEEHERKKKEYQEALDKLIRSKPQEERYEYPQTSIPERKGIRERFGKGYKHREMTSESETWMFNKELITFIIITVMIFVAIIVFLMLKKN